MWHQLLVCFGDILSLEDHPGVDKQEIKALKWYKLIYLLLSSYGRELDG